MAVRPRTQPKRPWLALGVLAVLIAGLGWILYLRLTDQPLRDPFGFFVAEPSEVVPAAEGLTPIEPPAEGMVRALVPARRIEPYAKVTRDDLYDPSRRMFTYVDLDEDFTEENGVLTDAGEIIGRVMRRTKSPGYVFTEADFYPKGTRPGIAAGVPPGKRALRIDVDLVRGIIGLNPGDRFDLIATRTVAAPSSGNSTADQSGAGSTIAGVYSSLVKRPGAPAPVRSTDEARVDVIVQGGVVVTPLETRLIPTTSASLTSGQINGTRPVQEMIVALAPEEVAPLTAALRLKADLTCVARSGHPDDEVTSETPGLLPDEADPEEAAAEDATARAGFLDREVSVVETLHGGARALTAIPRPASAVDAGEATDAPSADAPAAGEPSDTPPGDAPAAGEASGTPPSDPPGDDAEGGSR